MQFIVGTGLKPLHRMAHLVDDMLTQDPRITPFRSNPGEALARRCEIDALSVAADARTAITRLG
ncbi:hypothetical protein [Novosphingobium sp. P6W]|uniref:hypothetical protein n=1 Tax=Novosphingobium sp. P6W TaxID=1609758 RepID=UPI0013B452C8|nr:hypothetical protein [Novosphingobium sp. P6W]